MQMMRMLDPEHLMYCVAGYPSTITGDDFDYFSHSGCDGFSDHTVDIHASLAMIQAGATIIEKHFKLDNNCVDTAFSLDPTQMEWLCRIAHR